MRPGTSGFRRCWPSGSLRSSSSIVGINGLNPPVIESVVKRYAAVTAVDGVSFAVERREVFALLGAA